MVSRPRNAFSGGVRARQQPACQSGAGCDGGCQMARVWSRVEEVAGILKKKPEWELHQNSLGNMKSHHWPWRWRSQLNTQEPLRDGATLFKKPELTNGLQAAWSPSLRSQSRQHHPSTLPPTGWHRPCPASCSECTQMSESVLAQG